MNKGFAGILLWKFTYRESIVSYTSL